MQIFVITKHRYFGMIQTDDLNKKSKILSLKAECVFVHTKERTEGTLFLVVISKNKYMDRSILKKIT